MKKIIVSILTLAIVLSMSFTTVLAVDVTKKEANSITDSEVFYSSSHYLAGTPIPTGFDEYGYNYQGHMFKGSYYNSYAGGAGYPAWESDETYPQVLEQSNSPVTTYTNYYDDLSLTGGYESGNFEDVYDLTKGDVIVKFTYDGNGLVDESGAHAWSEFGVRTQGAGNFNPSVAGVWLATDYDWTPGTFDPDVTPTLDLDDKLILQKTGGNGESDYNLPSTPPSPSANHRFWWDRDGVDPWQNDETANTGGIYEIEIHLHANDDTTGTAYMKINDLWQGFETDGDWSTIELTPAGMTFTGDMTKMQVFYGLYGYGAEHSVEFRDISVDYFDFSAYSHWAYPYRDVELTMKWNDAWLSNLDRDLDGVLDRYWGFASYIGSGAWLTNHQSGEYQLDGEIIQWNYFTKIVAVPADAVAVDGIWYSSEGTEIGPVIWGAFATIQTVENDPGADVHGSQYISPYSTAFGDYYP